MLTTFMSLAIALGCAVQAAVLYYILVKRKPASAVLEEQQNTVTGNIGNLAARDVVIKEKSKPCERERFYFAQCKDLSNTVNTLFKQLQHTNKLNIGLQAQLKKAEKTIRELQKQNRRLPVLPVGNWKKEEEKKDVA